MFEMSGSNIFEVELQSLESIYDKDLMFDGNSVIIRLHPLQNGSNDEIYAQIDLQVDCPADYPRVLPNISLKNCRGLSNKQVNILTSKLQSIALTLIGKPMIYDLAYHVLNYLLDNNKPGKKSFYDEMISRKQQEEAKFKSEEDRRMRKIHDVHKKVQKRMEESNSSDEDDFENKVDFGLGCIQKCHIQDTNSANTENEVLCNPVLCCCSKYIHFGNKVLRGCCLDHHECSTVYCALDTTTGEQLTVHEWNLIQSQQAENIEKMLKSIENELNYLKILNHENLNSYVDFKCITEKDECTVYIAEKYISDVTLKKFIEQQWIFDLDSVQNIVENILKALLYLHDHNVVHKKLSDSSIYFSKSGKIKIASYSVTKRMDDLFKMCHNQALSDTKSDPKNDIKQLGVILSSVLELTSKSTLISDHKLSAFKDLIEKCLFKNEERRWNARELQDHKFFKNSLLYEPSGNRKSSYSNVNFEFCDELQDQYDFSTTEQNSRLLKDFTILEDIGKGSFGKVLKVQNKLDRQIYAIKEIRLDKNSNQLDKKIIREVKLLSKLKHENVVRYYTSWIESYSDNSSSVSMNKSKVEEEDGEDEEDFDEDDDTSDDDFCQKSEEQDSFVVFQDEDRDSLGSSTSHKRDGDKKHNVIPVKIMYIQMEFCEKSTLKYAIKNKLHTQEARYWRLLREIVEGLTYIHEQGLIHRDLKPDNIFLDCSDHVKIGDFGLAKIRGISKHTLIITEVSLGHGGSELSHYTQGDSDTAGVGTSYYVAPEMDTAFERSHYNEKVDIYSLGIIFFEMCHPPFNTGMERHDILTKLRRVEIVIPVSMEESMPRQMEFVRMLLNRDPASRPSSQEILEEHVPPAEIEFEELKEIVRKTLKSPETKCYKYLISSCLNQKTSLDDVLTNQLQNYHSDKFYISLEMAKEAIEKVFKSHGAVYLSTPLLLPQSDVYTGMDALVKLMTQSGAVVNLSYDLRVPFASYITFRNIRRFRRYAIDRIHRDQKINGELPKELHEYAFDIVSPKLDNLADEWEILSVMDKIVNNISSLKSKNCVILMNHALILRALLLYFNIEKLYSVIFKFLLDAKINKYGRRQLEANLLSLELGVQLVNTLVNFFTKEETIYALKQELLALFTNRADVYEKAENGFNKLINIIEGAENFDVHIPIRVRLGIVCNTEYCSDIMFDLVCKTKQKRGKQCMEMIMSGCRYDGLLRNLRKLFSVMNVDIKEKNQSAIGVSVSLDKIVSILKEDNVLSEHVVVCSTDYWIHNREKTSFIKELRESGIKCYFEDAVDDMEELIEYCGENKVSHIVNLKEENGLIVIMSWDSSKCRYREKKISKREVAEYILKNSKISEDQAVITYQRSDSKSCTGEISNSSPSLNIHILSEDKSLTRRKYENQIKSKVSSFLRYFSPRTRIEVVGVDLEEGEISRLAMSFKHDDSSYMSKILSAADRSSKKAYLSKICNKLESFFTPEKSNVLIILYGLSHDKYQIIMT